VAINATVRYAEFKGVGMGNYEQFMKENGERDFLAEVIAKRPSEYARKYEALEAKNSALEKHLTVYIVKTAYSFCHEQDGESFALSMIRDAGISMENEDDATVLNELGQEFVDMVKRLGQ